MSMLFDLIEMVNLKESSHTIHKGVNLKGSHNAVHEELVAGHLGQVKGEKGDSHVQSSPQVPSVMLITLF